ncbi:hypothetical protein NEHOM01_1952 [Nematocida homosporus]|uniref:uncharacterized protein n=1 Tax=Nematocida homosporus TaxID=1912981 RepID=UPI002220E3F6|nr:uncharacterized protein NEHOM01_1952 [Nematocida homosporus]KAI5187126.1 hypothetical protein NEHOM01_1952 [Nematocida homosporus]
MSSIKFLKNLYAVASSGAHSAIQWNNQGNGILILDKNRFIRESLPSICKSDEYGTFIRQLNNYGFSKVKTGGVDEFVNEHFQKDSPESLLQLKRRNFTEKTVDLQALQNNQYQLHASMCEINEVNRSLLQELYHLKGKVEQQEKTINELVRAFIRIFNKQSPKQAVPQLESGSVSGRSELGMELPGQLSSSEPLEMLLEEDTTSLDGGSKTKVSGLSLDEFLNEEYDGV